ncbi:hypothetical protein [Tenacibaculum sp.]|uniref:hypothetical protein n=1 Tax=Tenacibaculum sp. TaxID=1906242 RepID=UPI003AA9493B
MKTTKRIALIAMMGVSLGIKVQAQAITDTGDKVGIGTTTPQSKLHVVGNENGGLIVNHNYKYGYPNYGIKIIGDQSTTKSGEVTLSVYGGGAYSGFDLAHGATYYGSGAYKTGANVNSSSRIIGYGGNLRFYTNANLAENTNFSPTQRMVINSSGNVGIGTTSPSKRMHIKGSTGSYDQLLVEGGVSAAIQLESKENIGDRPVISGNNGSFSIQIWKNRSSWKSTPFHINQSGNIGIGTTDTKGFKLGVNGKIAATEVKVATYANWSDFVFYEDYQLPTLTEVENHIKEKGHLKDIPSAKEVEKNGFFLGEMDAKLLQKIEELTLYTIAQEKKIRILEKQNSKIEAQEKEIEELKKQNFNIQELVNKLIEEKK